METSTKYKTDKRSPGFRRQVLKSDYFEAVKNIACSLLNGDEYYQSENEELCDRAIEITDKLIERVGEKL